MTTQTELQLGMNLRDYGLDLVEANNLTWIERLRKVAQHISNVRGSVSADDLRRYAAKHNDYPAHQNAWGGVFRGNEWLAIGRKKSTTVTAHARWIMVWRWVARTERKVA